MIPPHPCTEFFANQGKKTVEFPSRTKRKTRNKGKIKRPPSALPYIRLILRFVCINYLLLPRLGRSQLPFKSPSKRRTRWLGSGSEIVRWLGSFRGERVPRRTPQGKKSRVQKCTTDSDGNRDNLYGGDLSYKSLLFPTVAFFGSYPGIHTSTATSSKDGKYICIVRLHGKNERIGGCIDRAEDARVFNTLVQSKHILT